MVCQIHATRRLRTPDLSLPPTPPSTFSVPLNEQHALHPTWRRMGWIAHVVDSTPPYFCLHRCTPRGFKHPTLLSMIARTQG